MLSNLKVAISTKLEREEVEALAKLVGEVKTLLTKKLSMKVEQESRFVNAIDDAVARGVHNVDLMNWEAGMQLAIDGVSPLESQLTQVRTSRQKAIKANLVLTMRQIADNISAKRPVTSVSQDVSIV